MKKNSVELCNEIDKYIVRMTKNNKKLTPKQKEAIQEYRDMMAQVREHLVHLEDFFRSLLRQ